MTAELLVVEREHSVSTKEVYTHVSVHQEHVVIRNSLAHQVCSVLSIFPLAFTLFSVQQNLRNPF